MSTPQQNPPSQNKPSWPGASLALFILGLCILVPAGLCTGTAIVIYPPAVLVFLMLGGVPTAIGAALIWGALRARRAAVGTMSGPVPAPLSKPPDTRVNVALLVIGLLVLVPAGLYTVSSLGSIFSGSIFSDFGSQEVLLMFVLFVVPGFGLTALGAWLVYTALPHHRA